MLAASEAIRLGAHFGFDAGLQLGVLRANVELASQLAERARLVLPLLEATNSAWSEAEGRLGYGADHSAIIRWLESLTVETPEPAGGQTDQSA